MTKWIVLAWLAIGTLNFGMSNANSRAEFPSLAHGERWSRANCGFSTLLFIGGPIAFLPALFLSGFAYDGLSYKCTATP